MRETRTESCEKHGLTAFAKTKDNRWRCAKCSCERAYEHRKKMKEKAIAYKGGKCCRCGYSKCTSALEFHHLDPAEKDFAISGRGCTISWKKLEKELEKTILVCANCHREIHEELFGGMQTGKAA